MLSHSVRCKPGPQMAVGWRAVRRESSGLSCGRRGWHGGQMSGEPEAPGEHDFAPIAELAEAFTELVELLTDRQSSTLSPDRLVSFARRCMPAAQHVGLAVISDGQVRTLAATGPVVEQLEAIRRATGEGPALDVLEVNDLVYAGDLADDPRWPAFGACAAAQAGVRSAASYRLYLGRHAAALTFTSDWPYAFDEVALAIGAIFAAYCSLVLFTDLVLGDQLTPRRAAQVHREIGVAIGILLADTTGGADSHGSDPRRAYERLRQASQATRRSLHAVATDVITEHGVPTTEPDPAPDIDPAARTGAIGDVG